MPSSLTTAIAIGIPAVAIGGLYYLRRKVTSKWIHLSRYGADEIPTDLRGKVYVITGANTGLGYCVAEELARRGGTVVLGCRDAAKGLAAVERILAATSSSSSDNVEGVIVECVTLDLSDLRSVRQFSATVTKKYPQGIEALVCNAGVWIPMSEKRKVGLAQGGFEAHFAVNHLGHCALIDALTDHVKAANGRVVMVSSLLMKQGKLDMERKDFVYDGRHEEATETSDNGDSKKKKQSFNVPTGYADTKLMNALMGRYLATKYEKGMSTYTVCPGWCSSDLARNVQPPFYQKVLFLPVMFMFMRSALSGSQNILYVTLQRKDKLESGKFYRDGIVSETENKIVDDLASTDLDTKLWVLSKELIDSIQT